MVKLKSLSVLFLFFIVNFTISGSENKKNENPMLTSANYEVRYNNLKFDFNTQSQNTFLLENKFFGKNSLNKAKRLDLSDEIIGLIAFNAATLAAIGIGYATNGIDDVPYVLIGLDVVVSGLLTWKKFGGPFK